MTNVTLKQIEQAIRLEADAAPDFRYKDFIRKQDVAVGRRPRDDEDISCTYLDAEGCASCIVACAVVVAANAENELDNWLSILDANEGQNAYSLLSQLDDRTAESRRLRLWIAYVQGQQDDNVTWSESVRTADVKYNLN